MLYRSVESESSRCLRLKHIKLLDEDGTLLTEKMPGEEDIGVQERN